MADEEAIRCGVVKVKVKVRAGYCRSASPALTLAAPYNQSEAYVIHSTFPIVTACNYRPSDSGPVKPDECSIVRGQDRTKAYRGSHQQVPTQTQDVSSPAFEPSCRKRWLTRYVLARFISTTGYEGSIMQLGHLYVLCGGNLRVNVNQGSPQREV